MSETGGDLKEGVPEDEAQARLDSGETAAGTAVAASVPRSAGVRLVEQMKRHDLAPIHSMLLDLAISLQVKVNMEIQNTGRIRRRLSTEM
jgi:hypothetical protein